MIPQPWSEAPFAFPAGHGKVYYTAESLHTLASLDLNIFHSVITLGGQQYGGRDLQTISAEVLTSVSGGNTVLICDVDGAPRNVYLIITEIALSYFQCTEFEAMEWVRTFMPEPPAFTVDALEDDEEWISMSSEDEMNSAMEAADEAWSRLEFGDLPLYLERVAVNLQDEFRLLNTLEVGSPATLPAISGDLVSCCDRTFLTCNEICTTAEIEAFWREVWDRKIPLIFKLSDMRAPKTHLNLETLEREKVPGNRYWPTTKSTFILEHLGINVRLETIACPYARAFLRTFRMTAPDGEVHVVQQLDDHNWPDVQIPGYDNVSQALTEGKRLLATVDAARPVVVHCTKGIGPTGVFLMGLAVERMIHRNQIPDTLYSLRAERNGLIETVNQYLMVHRLFLSSTRHGARPPFFDLEAAYGNGDRGDFSLYSGYSRYPTRVHYPILPKLTLAEVTPKVNLLWELCRALKTSADATKLHLQWRSEAAVDLDLTAEKCVTVTEGTLTDQETNLLAEISKDLQISAEERLRRATVELGKQLDEEFRLIHHGLGEAPKVAVLDGHWLEVNRHRLLAFPEPRDAAAQEALWKEVFEQRVATVVKLAKSYRAPILPKGPDALDALDAPTAAGGSGWNWSDLLKSYPDLWKHYYSEPDTKSVWNQDYFPAAQETITLAGVGITMHCQEEVDLGRELKLRRFLLARGSETHVCHQLDFEGWPDMGVPTLEDLANLMSNYANLQPNGPTAVHCAMGRGRTGTFLAALGLIKLEKRAQIPELIATLRSGRSGLVETEGQYQLLHRLFHLMRYNHEDLVLEKPAFTSNINFLL